MNRILITGAITAGALLLAACGSGANSTDGTSTRSDTTMSSGATNDRSPAQGGKPAAGPHNGQDVGFATNMIPHHRQAVTMANLALDKASNSAVTQLAAAIKTAQSPEISAMSAWLVGWERPVPSPSMSMNHGGMPMPGMMSDAEMTKLGEASGTTFDRLWLTQMIAHHRGAVTMAKTELASGQNPDAKALARSIISGQSKEIRQMTKLLQAIK